MSTNQTDQAGIKEMPLLQMDMPEPVCRIIRTLKEAGFEAYAVGGCVRDAILGREPDDWDITTSASPWQTKSLFPRTIDTGIEHGTVTVMIQKQGFEVTTYRIDGEYEDKRHPSQVVFTSDLTEDLRRRDFTINAMAYNEQDGLVDVFEGVADLNKEVIRCVGDARERFEEDALRILRAVRFAGQLNFGIEAGTAAAMKALASNLAYISAERIQTELVKLLLSRNPGKLRGAYESGILEVILPELKALMEVKVSGRSDEASLGELSIRCVEYNAGSEEETGDKRSSSAADEKYLRLAALLESAAAVDEKQDQVWQESQRDEVFAEQCERRSGKILRGLKFDNQTIKTVGRLLRYQALSIEADQRSLRWGIYTVSEDLFPLWLQLRQRHAAVFGGDEECRQLEALEREYQIFCKNPSCVQLKQLAVKGNDLIALGVKPGKDMGIILTKLLHHVLDVPEDNERVQLEAIVKRELQLIVHI